MTNFYLSKWDGKLSNLGISKDIPVEERNATVTEYGMGYERMQIIDEVLKNGSPTDAMEAVSYRQMYRADYDKWTSEFLLRTNDPSTDLYYRQDMLNMESYKDFRKRALNACAEEDANDAKGIRPTVDKTWQTVHTATYDIKKKTLVMKSQQKLTDAGSYEFISEILVGLN